MRIRLNRLLVTVVLAISMICVVGGCSNKSIDKQEANENLTGNSSMLISEGGY